MSESSRIANQEPETNRTLADLSADEDDFDNDQPAVVNGIEGKTVSELTDDQLYEELIKRNVKIGPVLATTRQLYENKLAGLIREEHHLGEGISQEVTLDGKVRVTEESNGHTNGDHDEEPHLEQEPELENVEKLSKLSADEESTDDEQPSGVVKKHSNRRSASSSSGKQGLRKRFADQDFTEREGRGTPRKSIHSYKVTETTKHTMVKEADGSISQDFAHEKSEITNESQPEQQTPIRIGIIIFNLLMIVVIAVVVAYITAMGYSYLYGQVEELTHFKPDIQWQNSLVIRPIRFQNSDLVRNGYTEFYTQTNQFLHEMREYLAATDTSSDQAAPIPSERTFPPREDLDEQPSIANV